MPKVVDHQSRREEVCGAAMRILARSGPASLTLKSLAAELGGSISLVTYFFSKRDDLFDAIVEDLLSTYDDGDLGDELAVTEDPWDDLRRLALWLVPQSAEEDEREASRVALVSLRESAKSIDHFFVALEDRIRRLLDARLRPLVADSGRSVAVDVLRASINGLVLSVVEHPRRWPVQRRTDALDVMLDGIRELSRRHPVGVGADLGTLA